MCLAVVAVVAVFVFLPRLWNGPEETPPVLLMPSRAWCQRAAVVDAKQAVSVPVPEISAESFAVRIVGQNTLLATRNETRQMATASLIKVLTALLAYEELGAGERVIFSKDAKNQVATSMSTARAGEAFARDDAIKFALMSSSNDAALALAEAVGRKRGAHTYADALAAFVEHMNKRARAIGLAHSSFTNPTGLDDEGHLSTAQDLAVLFEYVQIHAPALLEISRMIETTIMSTGRKGHHIIHTNELLKEFPALLGSKTGFTDQAKGALALVYPIKRPNTVAIMVILGSDNRFEDGRRLIQWVDQVYP